MVTKKLAEYQTIQGEIAPDAWLRTMKKKLPAENFKMLEKAFELAQHLQKDQVLQSGFTIFSQSVYVAEILADLNLGTSSLTAVLLMYYVQNNELSIEDIQEGFDKTVAKLITGSIKMVAFSQAHRQTNEAKIDNLRKMLLAMVDDIRVVLIKLSEQTFLLRHAMQFEPEHRKHLAKMTFDIYAPLANRLGIGHLKWELEDYAFRYLEPEKYKELAKSLAEKRIDRESYVEKTKDFITENLITNQIKNFEVTGRAKHIYSIYKKMKRKSVGYEEIYDVIAVRVLTETIPDCYSALSCIHALWEHIPQEFDDYIATPKPNGYRSIHTAVIGPGQKNIEVQIRTKQMHQESELGIAAHWKYKEGEQTESSFEEKITWLRQLLEWKDELSEQNETQADIKHLFSDRVYVFTPEGDVIDLPKGATGLDFAYHIHTQLGHRCKGIKVNGNIAPLTYHLQTGERIEVLTGKEASPSRDWLSPHTGYLTTSKARAKVFHWFKKHDHDTHVMNGRAMYEKEIKHQHLPPFELSKLAKLLNYKHVDDMFAAISNNEIKLAQVCNVIKEHTKLATSDAEAEQIITPKEHPAESISPSVKIGNINNLLSTTARCCKPLPGDPIIGFITRGKGITIHRQDCKNILNTRNPKRLIPMAWQAKKQDAYPVDIAVHACDREGLIRDISTTIANEKIKLLAVQTLTTKVGNEVIIKLTVAITDLHLLKKLTGKLTHVPSITSVKRCRP